jgi:hypothetical protein
VEADVEENEAGEEGEERGSAVGTTSTGGTKAEEDSKFVVSVDSEAEDVITGVDTIVDGVGTPNLVSIIVRVTGPVRVKSLPLGSPFPDGTSWTMPPRESFGISPS